MFDNEVESCKYDRNKASCYSNSEAFQNYTITGMYGLLTLMILSMIFFFKKSYKQTKDKKVTFLQLTIWSVFVGIVFYFLSFKGFTRESWFPILNLKIFSIGFLILLAIGSSLFGYRKRIKKEGDDKIFSFVLNSVVFSFIGMIVFGLLLTIIDLLPELFANEIELAEFLYLAPFDAVVGIIFAIVLASLSSLITEFSINKGFIYNIRRLNWKTITLSLVIPAILLTVGSLISPLYKYWIPPSSYFNLVYEAIASIYFFYTGYVSLWIAIVMFSLFVSFLIPYIFSKVKPKTNGVMSSTIVIISILMLILVPLIFVEKQEVVKPSMPIIESSEPTFCEKDSDCSSERECIENKCIRKPFLVYEDEIT